VLFTDGIIESRNSDNEEFSEERLLKLIKANLKSSADELKERIISELNAFTSGVPQWDDMTLVIIKRLA
jgi:sigma-B regulation protein RsbU (phosphoserine phosphatase)